MIFGIPNDGGELYEYPCGLAEASAIHDKTMNTFILYLWTRNEKIKKKNFFS